MKRVLRVVVRVCSYRGSHAGAMAGVMAVVWMAPLAPPASGQWSGGPSPNPITYSGPVGIGMNTAPSYLLDVNGPIAIEQKNFGGYVGLYIIGNSPSNNWPTIGMGLTNSNAATVQGAMIAGQITNNAAGSEAMDLFFSTTSGGALNQRMRIASNGNVGIGTANPPYRLSVEGIIGARDIIVTSTPWSDNVFSPGYRLKPLSEVSAYIQQNHHLPDIPSEAEVKEKGVSVGEMQAKLLAKVEELTLHMIQQESENKELRQRIAQLETRATTAGR